MTNTKERSVAARPARSGEAAPRPSPIRSRNSNPRTRKRRSRSNSASRRRGSPSRPPAIHRLRGLRPGAGGVLFVVNAICSSSRARGRRGLRFAELALSFLRNRRISKFIENFQARSTSSSAAFAPVLPVIDCFRVIASEAQEPVRSEFRQIVESQTIGLSVGERRSVSPIACRSPRRRSSRSS